MQLMLNWWTERQWHAENQICMKNDRYDRSLSISLTCMNFGFMGSVYMIVILIIFPHASGINLGWILCKVSVPYALISKLIYLASAYPSHSNSKSAIFALDIDECADAVLNECSEKELCKNTDGSFTCSCNSGFQLQSDGRTCKSEGNLNL